MSDFLGFQHSPHELVEAAFARIATDEMQDLPFYIRLCRFLSPALRCLKGNGSAAY